MLKVENVTKYYGDNLAVDNLSFEVQDGEIFGLLGVNGAGKTTTFRMIIGLLNPTSGKITLNGSPINYDVTDSIGFLTEERSLLTKMTVKEQLIYYGTLKGMKEKDILERMDEWLKKFEISEYKDRKIKELSKGNQQKVQFISAVINNPKLLILDEPFSGLDPINVEMFMSAIKDFKEKGSSIIFSSHRMEHVELFCEKLVILVKGKSVLKGELKKIKKDYRKKNIHIKGDVDEEILKKIEGVVSVEKNAEEYIVKIESDDYIDDVFDKIKKSKHITKFSVEDPTLNEIFLSKVGEAYEN
ncbi:MAG: ATP-binding cassette domain-containing protein [Bacilli bacterium]|nr:ATP-binding cassette domain-containing protein [Bacilli bacterium]MBR1817486.1 ATP-binding cassette domain-containing protein [Bacilli bacterium]